MAKAERLADLRAGAVAEHQRHAAEQRRRGGHHDRPEPQQRSLADRVLGPTDARSRSAWMAKSTIMMPFFFTMPISRMMPIMRDQAEVEAEDHQRQRARRRPPTAGSTGWSADGCSFRRARPGSDRRRPAPPAISSGTVRSYSWKAWALPWNVAAAPAGNSAPRSIALDRLGRRAERYALRQVEADRDRRELALVADRQRRGLACRPPRERRQRHLLARSAAISGRACRASDVALQLRQDLHDHVIAVLLGEILGDLPLAERVVERVVDQLRADAVARGLIAIDGRGSRRGQRTAGRWRRRAARAAP